MRRASSALAQAQSVFRNGGLIFGTKNQGFEAMPTVPASVVWPQAAAPQALVSFDSTIAFDRPLAKSTMVRRNIAKPKCT